MYEAGELKPSGTIPPANVVSTTVSMQQDADTETWGGFFRTNFSVFVLLFMVVFIFIYTALLIIHHENNPTLLQWIEGHSNTFVGALVGALTSNGVTRLANRISSNGGK
jgi:hypothetical protein